MGPVKIWTTNTAFFTSEEGWSDIIVGIIAHVVAEQFKMGGVQAHVLAQNAR